MSSFISSADLKSWAKESNFGGLPGAHGGVWECPDLFTLTYMGKRILDFARQFKSRRPPMAAPLRNISWVNSTGISFTPVDNQTKWLDYGPDEYAWSDLEQYRKPQDISWVDEQLGICEPGAIIKNGEMP